MEYKQKVEIGNERFGNEIAHRIEFGSRVFGYGRLL